MTLARTGAIAAVVAVVLGACSSESGQPQGLAGGTSSPEATTTTPSAKDSPTAEEPEPTFTQPYVPGDPSVIAIPDQFPVETDLDLDAQEQEVADALGHAMAAWDAMLFGVDAAEAGIETWFGRALLVSLRDYAAESQQIERVNVGTPTRIVLHGVEVQEQGATIAVCLYTEGWVQYIGGEQGEPVDEMTAYRMPVEHDGENWRFTDASTADELDC